MTKADLVREISHKTGIIYSDTKLIVDSLLETVRENMKNGEHIELRRFGTFKNKVRKPRVALNPNTKEKIYLPERVMPTFKFSKLFVDQVAKKD
jgi:nucleoid DNA-binding protein